MSRGYRSWGLRAAAIDDSALCTLQCVCVDMCVDVCVDACVDACVDMYIAV